MKRIIITLLVLLGFALGAMAQDNENSVRYDGMYVAQTGGDGVSKVTEYKTFMYLRFVDNGKVYVQTASSNNAEAISRWFGPNMYEYSGTSKIDGSAIEVLTNNEGSNNLAVDGPMNLNFRGKILSSEALSLEVEHNDGRKEVFDFKFAEIEKWVKIVK